MSLSMINVEANFSVIAIIYMRSQDPNDSCHPIGVGARSRGVSEAVLYILKA